MILLSGATGFIGSYFLFSLLAEGKSVKAIRRESSSLNQVKLAFDCMNNGKFKDFDTYMSNIDWCYADLLNFADLESCFENVDEVFHLAAGVSFQGNVAQDIIHNNLQTTRNMLHQCQLHGVHTFHFCSSIAALGRGDKAKIDEQDFNQHKKFSSAYALSKYLSEMEVWRAYQEGMQGVVVNPGVVIGPAVDEQEVSKIFRMIQKGFSYYTNGVNGYVDVRDVASFFLHLSQDSSTWKQRYILSSENVSYEFLFKRIAAAFELQTNFREAGKPLGKLVHYMDSIRSFFMGRKAVITTQLLKLVYSKHFYDNQKVRKATGRDFISIGDSVAFMCQHLK
jgi:dihydroflavonol-4-reductase